MDSLLGILLVIAIVVVDSLQSRRRKKSQHHSLPTEQPDPSAQKNAQPPRSSTQEDATAARLPSLEEAIELMKKQWLAPFEASSHDDDERAERKTAHRNASAAFGNADRRTRSLRDVGACRPRSRRPSVASGARRRTRFKRTVARDRQRQSARDAESDALIGESRRHERSPLNARGLAQRHYHGRHLRTAARRSTV